jgi:hypothetical protein
MTPVFRPVDWVVAERAAAEEELALLERVALPPGAQVDTQPNA